MSTQTLQLLNRLRDTFREEREWFDLLSNWYKNTRLTYRALEEFSAGEEMDLLKLSVNH